MISTKLLPIEKIRIDGGTQIRVSVNESAVTDYADRMQDGDKFPNPHVFFDGSDYWLADGFHRYHAFARLGATEIRCEVHNGTAIDARRFALSANGANGLRMTNEDKRKAVAWGLELYPAKSSRELAKICYVSHNFVETCRKQLSSDDSSTREGADGKTYSKPPKRNQVSSDDTCERSTPEEDNEAEALKSQAATPTEKLTAQAPALLAAIEVDEVRQTVKLTPNEAALIDALEVAKANIEYLLDCVAGHSCDVAVCGEAAGNFRELASLVIRYQKEISK